MQYSWNDWLGLKDGTNKSEILYDLVVMTSDDYLNKNINACACAPFNHDGPIETPVNN